MEKLIDRTENPEEPEALYTRLELPEPPPERPYVVVNMVSTADGKITLGPGGGAKGLGSPTDQLLMRRIQANADGALIGAGTLRPGNVIYRPEMWRAVVTQSGNLPLANRFFTDAPGKAIVFAPESLPRDERRRIESAAQIRTVGADRVDPREALRLLRREYGIRALAMEGGATLNCEFFALGLVDELFLTLAPKIKGGASRPTVVDGPGLPGGEWIGLDLLSLYRDGDEFYFRYRVGARHGIAG